MPAIPQKRQRDQAVDVVVLDQQNLARPRHVGCALGHRQLPFGRPWQLRLKEEQAPLRPACITGITTHERGQMANDGQPQPGTAKTTGGSRIGLRKRVEKPPRRRRGHTDTGIFDLEPNPPRLGARQDPNPNPACGRKFDRVGDQIR